MNNHKTKLDSSRGRTPEVDLWPRYPAGSTCAHTKTTDCRNPLGAQKILLLCKLSKSKRSIHVITVYLLSLLQCLALKPYPHMCAHTHTPHTKHTHTYIILNTTSDMNCKKLLFIWNVIYHVLAYLKSTFNWPSVFSGHTRCCLIYTVWNQASTEGGCLNSIYLDLEEDSKLLHSRQRHMLQPTSASLTQVLRKDPLLCKLCEDKGCIYIVYRLSPEPNTAPGAQWTYD